MYFSDVLDTESESVQSTGSTETVKSSHDDDMVLAVIAGLSWSHNVRTVPMWAFSVPIRGANTQRNSSCSLSPAQTDVRKH